jgi:predicted MFS family arabinose efflux permease
MLVALATWAPLAPAGCVLAGLGFYMLHNTLQTNATQMAPRRRGAGMALFATSYFLGQSAGVAIAGIAAEALGTTPLLAASALLVMPVGFLFARLRRSRALERDS